MRTVAEPQSSSAMRRGLVRRGTPAFINFIEPIRSRRHHPWQRRLSKGSLVSRRYGHPGGQVINFLADDTTIWLLIVYLAKFDNLPTAVLEQLKNGVQDAPEVDVPG